MAPLERASMNSYSTLLVTMALSASVSKLQPFEICLTSFDLSRSLKVKANGAICKSMYDFLFNFNSNHDAKCHRLEDTALWKQVT